MADPNLEKARGQLAVQRDLIIDALAQGYKAGLTESHIASLLKIQSGIDVLDALIADDADEDDGVGG